METTKKELRSKIAKLETQKQKLKDTEHEYAKTRYKLTAERDEEIAGVIAEYLDDALRGDEEISYSSAYFKISRRQEGYNREIMTLIFKGEDYRQQDFRTIESSCYSSSTASKFDLRRLVLIGDIAEILLDDDKVANILKDVNRINDDAQPEINKIYKEEHKYYRKADEVRDEIRKVKAQLKDVIINEDGIVIAKNTEKKISHHRWYPEFDVKFDYSLYGVKEVKLLSKTKSGKSATIKVKYYTRLMSGDEGDLKETEVKNVRMDKILDFYDYNKDKLVEQDTVAS